MRCYAVLLLLVLTGLPQVAEAGLVTSDSIRPVAAQAGTEIGAPHDRKAVYTIDGSGLNAAGQHNTGPNGQMWLSDFTTTDSIRYDLGAPMMLSGFHVWNYNESGNFTNRGVSSATIKTSADGVSWSATTVTPYPFTKAPGSSSYAGDDYTFSTPVVARYVDFDPVTNFGGPSSNTVGLSEIRFTTPSLITGVTATASSEWLPGNRVASKAVDGSGMSGFADERADSNPGNMWLADIGNIVGRTITFDLQDVHVLQATRIWNYNEAGGSYRLRGVKEFDIAVSLDDSSYQTLVGPGSGGHFGLAMAPGTDGYVLADMIDLGRVPARYVRFTVQDYYGSNPGNDYVGLSEVRFYEYVPEPSTLLIWSLLAGLAVGVGWRRRKR